MIASASNEFAKLQQPYAFAPDLAAQFLLATTFAGAGIVIAPAGALCWYLQRKAR